MGLFAGWKRRRREKQRLLFSFWDGQQTRRADPFRLYRDLQNDPTVDIEAAAPFVDEGKEPETTKVVTAIAKAFAVERWDPETETGLADWEILNLMGDLSTYLLDIKKKYSLGQTPPAPTAPPSSTTLADLAAATKPLSGLPSTPDEQTPDTNT